MFIEQRADPRERLALPLRLRGGERAVTRNISAHGLFFEIDGVHDMAGVVDFELRLADAGMRFTAVGEVVRIEYRDSRTGVAVRLMSPKLEPIEKKAG